MKVRAGSNERDRHFVDLLSDGADGIPVAVMTPTAGHIEITATTNGRWRVRGIDSDGHTSSEHHYPI